MPSKKCKIQNVLLQISSFHTSCPGLDVFLALHKNSTAEGHFVSHTSFLKQSSCLGCVFFSMKTEYIIRWNTAV